jgi:curved DNA-binding protein CbpA
MSPDPTDLYDVLGLTPQATQEQIRRAYRTLMRQNHPDTHPQSDPAANAASNTTLQQVIAAYTILRDPARRASYDHCTTPSQPSTPTRNRPRMPVPRHPLDQPPIQAGPVHWHPSRP